MLSVNDKLSDTDAVGIGRKGTIDKPLYLKAPFWTVDTLFYCISKESSDVKFIYLLFQIINWKRYDESTGVPSLSKNTISSIKTYVPKVKEQDHISKLFFSLDNTLQLHERKCEELALIKKALLQELFPKKDEIKPEVRYKNFSDAWEQRRLGEGTIKIGDGLHGTPKYSTNGDVQFINGNNLINGKVVVTSETKKVTSSEQSKDDKELNQNTILMSINGTIGSLAWYRNENLMLGKSVAYIEVSKFDKKFVYTYLQTDKVKYYFMNSLTGTTIKNLGLKAIRETPLLIPNIEEQQKIGSFFQHLDSLIALHQRKLEKILNKKYVYISKNDKIYKRSCRFHFIMLLNVA